MKQRKDFYKQLRSGLNLAPNTPFEINYSLAYWFKKWAINKSYEEKMAHLILLSNKIIEIDLTKNPYIKRRSKKHPTNKNCFVCRIKKANCQHHIILLKNGGYDSGINRIPICESCHKEIHPWM